MSKEKENAKIIAKRDCINTSTKNVNGFRASLKCCIIHYITVKIYGIIRSSSLLLFSVQAAFRDNTVGLPKLCPPENIGKFNSTILQDFIKRYYQPSRIVIAGVNVDHQHLIDLTNDYFVNKPPMWHREGEATESPDRSIAQYTGGIIKVFWKLQAFCDLLFRWFRVRSVRSALDQAFLVQVVAWVIVVSSWSRDFTPKVPLSTQVYTENVTQWRKDMNSFFEW